MLKVKYHKNCHKHAELAKVKRQLAKACKVAEANQYISVDIALTGIEDLNFNVIYCHCKNEYENLRNRISKDIEENEEYDRYKISAGIISLKFIKELEIALLLIGEYPEIPFKVIDYKFESNTVEDKYKESKNYFQSLRINGFNHEWYAIEENGKTRLYGLFFVKEDLNNAHTLRLKYQ